MEVQKGGGYENIYKNLFLSRKKGGRKEEKEEKRMKGKTRRVRKCKEAVDRFINSNHAAICNYY